MIVRGLFGFMCVCVCAWVVWVYNYVGVGMYMGAHTHTPARRFLHMRAKISRSPFVFVSPGTAQTKSTSVWSIRHLLECISPTNGP